MLTLLGALAGCHTETDWVPRWEGTQTPLLDGDFVLEWSGAPAALALTSASLMVLDDRNRPLLHEARLEGSRLVIRLVLGTDLLAAPPTELRVRLMGRPSLHAWRSRDGRWLERSVELRRRLGAGLLPAGAEAPRLRTAQGAALPTEGLPSVGGVIELTVLGRLDPQTLDARHWPLFPVSPGLSLPAVFPDVRWSLVGERCDVRLLLPDSTVALELRTRALGVRDRAGRALEPAQRVPLLGSDVAPP